MGFLSIKDVGEYTWELPEVPTYSVSNLQDGNIIAVWNKETNESEHDFLVSRVVDGEIFGHYLSEQLGAVEVKYPHANWVYLGSILK